MHATRCLGPRMISSVHMGHVAVLSCAVLRCASASASEASTPTMLLYASREHTVPSEAVLSDEGRVPTCSTASMPSHSLPTASLPEARRAGIGTDTGAAAGAALDELDAASGS